MNILEAMNHAGVVVTQGASPLIFKQTSDRPVEYRLRQVGSSVCLEGLYLTKIYENFVLKDILSEWVTIPTVV